MYALIVTVLPMNDLSTMNKIMEYMAVEKPIVQFKTTERRISAQGASLYAKTNDPSDFAEKILELTDPERRARMGEFGYRRCRSSRLATRGTKPAQRLKYAVRPASGARYKAR
jgi:glycosyltransferase involved in cell wall biosynthesis